VADDEPGAAGSDELLDRVADAGGEVVPGLAVGRRPRPATPVGQLVRLGVDLSGGAAAPRADVDLPPARVDALRLEPQQRGGLPGAREIGDDHPLRSDAEPLDERPQLDSLRSPGVGQRRVELPLQAMLGVPGGLAVADEEEAVVGHGVVRYPSRAP
jgi:hypothetical protein